MDKRRMKIGLSLVLGVTAVFLCVHLVAARKWVSDDDEFWQVEQVCRDGARISLINEQTIASAAQPNKVIDVDVQARRLTRPFEAALIDPATGWFTSTESKADLAFYPLVSAGRRFTETVYQVDPFYADLDDDGSDDPAEDYFLLYTAGELYWPQELAVGAPVLFPANFGVILEQVDDCRLDPLNVDEEVLIELIHFGPDYSSVVSLDPANPDPYTIVDADDLIYRVEAAPQFGSLSLGGNELTVGDVFSRTRLEGGAFMYHQDSPTPNADGLRFSLQATYEGSLSADMGVNPIDPTTSRFGRFEVSAANGQIFVEDILAGCTLRVSENLAGEGGNGVSAAPSISADGRFVAFQSEATNLVPGDTNAVSDIFVYDRDADEDFQFYSDQANCVPGSAKVSRVSVAGNGGQADGASTNALISGNGEFVQFDSAAANLVPGAVSGPYVHYIGFSARIDLTPPYSLFFPMLKK